VRQTTLWELGVALEGFRRANSPSDTAGKAPSDEAFEAAIAKFGA
jgi:hypothetical protein